MVTRVKLAWAAVQVLAAVSGGVTVNLVFADRPGGPPQHRWS